MLFNFFKKDRKPDTDGHMVYTYQPDQCGNCHRHLEDNDKYCRYCGTKRGEGKFLPYYNIMECIYGPMPEKRVHICKSCHFQWETEMMIDNQKYCPICGNSAPITSDICKTQTIQASIEVDGRLVPLEIFPFILGRDSDANYRFSEPVISRKHAKITYENGLLFITDLNSMNGTFLNDKRLAPLESEPIVSGDCITLGKSERINVRINIY